MFWLKLRQCKGSILPHFLTLWRPIWQVDKIIADDENRAACWGFSKFLSNYFLWLKQGSSVRRTCMKTFLQMQIINEHTIKNPQHGIRAQMVLKLTSYKWRKLKLTAALTSRSERVRLNYDARIRLQTKIFKQTLHHHLYNSTSFPLIYIL